MADKLGTRTRQSFQKERNDQGSETRGHTADLGMVKRIDASITFTASNGRATAASPGTFAGSFVAGDPVLIERTLLNNGFFTITAGDGVNAQYLVLDPPPKNEGPLNVLLRTP